MQKNYFIHEFEENADEEHLKKLQKTVDNYEAKKVNLMEFLQKQMEDVVDIEIFQTDPVLCNYIVNCFKAEKIEEPEISDQLGETEIYIHLLICYLMHVMKNKLKKYDRNLANDYKQIAIITEEKAIRCLQNNGEEILEVDHLTRLAKIYKYEQPLVKNYEVMGLAFIAKCKKFLSQPACTELVKMRWLEFPKTGTIFQEDFSINIVSIFSDAIRGGYEDVNKGFFETLSTFFFSRPRAKLFWDLLFKFFLIILFAVVLLVEKPNQEDIMEFTTNKFSILLLLLGVAKISMFSLHQCGILKKVRVWSVFRNSMFFINCVLFVLIYTPKYPWIDVAFETSLFISWLVSMTIFLRTLSVFRSLSLYVTVIKEVLATCTQFLLLYLLLWIVLSVLHLSVTGEHHKSNSTLLMIASKRGLFEIFGEVRDEDSNGDYNDSTRYRLCYPADNVRCQFWSVVLPVIVGLYIFICAIVLTSILVAHLSKLFDKKTDRSEELYNFSQYSFLIRYESMTCPRPLFFLLNIFCCLIPSCFKLCYECFKADHEGIFVERKRLRDLP